ncbi:MAG TPA: ATP-dependent Clp protease proteolytic subunit [Anaerolineales bacterium]
MTETAPLPIPADRKSVKQPPLLFEQTQSLIVKLERQIRSKLLVYWTSDRGSVCDNDVVALYEIFKHMGTSEDLSVFIKSNGGDGEAALRIVNLMREYNRRVHALVPLESASAATLIALGADDISMGPLAHLTAIDSSLVHDMSPIDERNNRRVSVSQDELARIVSLWNANAREHHGNPYTDIFQYIHPLVVGAIDRSSSLSIKICKEILAYHIKDDAECERISRSLNSDYPSHSYPIMTGEARRLGLHVSTLDPRVNDMLLELNACYSEMAQKALTDFNEYNYHDNEIINIHEARGLQVYYQNDKDWNYIQAERRWQTLNDESSWRVIKRVKGQQVQSILHIR